MSGAPEWLRHLVRDVPDFPRPGVVFKDITPVLADGRAFGTVIDGFVQHFRVRSPDLVLGIEARGFIVAAPVAHMLGAGFIPARKKGKLPRGTHGADYDLEYGTERLELHRDAVRPGQRVLVADDVLATGGTAATAVSLLRELGAEVVGIGVIIELAFLDGRSRLPDDIDLFAMMAY